MRQRLLFPMLCVLLLAAFPATGESHDERLPVTMITSEAAPPDHDQVCPGPQVATGLGGPTVGDLPGCTFMREIRAGFLIVGVVVDGPAPFTGALTAHITSDSGNEVAFSCSYMLNQLQGCRLTRFTGYPSPGEGFLFDCYSEAGSVGTWGGCYLKHDT